MNAVAVLPRRFPDLINDNAGLAKSSFVVRYAALRDLADTVRATPAPIA